ncbi:MAG TPA: PEP-CTERM sorting domain-containing protein [Gemmatimonadaceae bacterium]|nr:PEP-CTERM sorting domain-containing protein [Gemmatimonadaceae bacterium]
MRRLLCGLSTLALTLGAAAGASAQAVRSGFLDVPLPRGDDIYTNSTFGFAINYFGTVSDVNIVCSNGYVILGAFAPSGPTCAFPGPLSVLSAPDLNNLRTFYGSLLAPYFADVNTAFEGNPGGLVYYGTGTVNGMNAWAATWDGVAGWGGPTSLTFQTVLIDRGAGDFTMEFNYGFLGWPAEGGIGFTDDGGVTGEPVVAELATDQPPINSRLTCVFTDGVPSCSDLVNIPEPSTVVLLGSALLGLAGLAVRRRGAR